MASPSVLLVIPARYGSTRLPGKPLLDIAGKTLLQRVAEIGSAVAERLSNTRMLIATDDERILEHAQALKCPVVLTEQSCATGTDRCYQAAKIFAPQTDIIVSLQGDAPLTPVHFISALINVMQQDAKVQIATPVTQLTWQSLQQLRTQKLTTPHSGTTVILDEHDNARWFSKQIIPAIRREEQLMTQTKFSPVYKHIGVYAYRQSALEKFVHLTQTNYEILEGLEQLRALEHGINIRAVKVVQTQYPFLPGVDTLEDAQRAAALITQFGELQL